MLTDHGLTHSLEYLISESNGSTYAAVDDFIDGHQLTLVLGFGLTFGLGAALWHTLGELLGGTVCGQRIASNESTSPIQHKYTVSSTGINFCHVICTDL